MISSLILTSTILANLITPIEVPVKIDPMPAILEKLAYCESSHNPKAINVMDGDASSFGLYQMKIKTFVWAGRKYGLEHSDIWDTAQQGAIVKAMIEDGLASTTIGWKNCWKKMNLAYE